MKKFAVVLLILSLARVGVAYADTETASSDAYSTGTSVAPTNANQILYFFRGADGTNGTPGADGRDGLDGKDGLDGANGVNVSTTAFTGEKGGCTTGGIQISSADSVTFVCNGANGSGVSQVAFTGTRGECRAGGVEFVASNGTISRVCNGTNGTDGASGGSGGGTNIYNTYVTGSDTTTGTLQYGIATLRVSACEADGKIHMEPNREFNGSIFVFGSINLGTNDVSIVNGDIKSTCEGKTVSFYFTIKSSGVSTNAHYVANDVIACKRTLPAAGAWPANNGSWQFTIDKNNSSCGKYGSLVGSTFTKVISPTFNFEMTDINTDDYTDKIGFEIG